MGLDLRRGSLATECDPMANTELDVDLRTAVRELCSRFPDSYWRELDARDAYPEEFVKTLTDAGYGAINPPVDIERDGEKVARA